MNKDIEKVKVLDPCKDGFAWFKEQPDFKTAWETCKRGDWMLWYAASINVDLKPLTLAKGHCANIVRHLMEDERSIAAVDAAIAFGEGRITREELDKAANAAYDAVSSAANAVYYAYAAAYAAYYAANAAYAASSAAYAYAAYAASAAVNSADYYAVYSDHKKEVLKQCSDICRKYLTKYVL